MRTSLIASMHFTHLDWRSSAATFTSMSLGFVKAAYRRRSPKELMMPNTENWSGKLQRSIFSAEKSTHPKTVLEDCLWYRKACRNRILLPKLRFLG
ncbi:hypothetical protein L596_010026 [Steinernema carpocapsae]|uniref:Uncharacterized protein n=1 Tax=Steinernema carpocapsae TaxID=34508 RepID=A0A4U5PHD6_STECR|nr:hypothetical protein L596_010026 [Steinernema carpocapsae]